jgi:DNA-binding Lrp family transcriptional regulator
MDDVDRKMLAELQRDGRLTLTELAERVRLSVSPCHRRLRTLERSGAITGYHARLDASTLGLTFEALVFVTMRYEDRQTIEAGVVPGDRSRAFQGAQAAVAGLRVTGVAIDSRL